MDIYFLLEDINLGGGGERVVSILAKCLKNKNYNVKIITCINSKKMSNYDYDVEIIELNIKYETKNKIEKIKFWIKVLWKLKKYLRNKKGIILGIGLDMNILISFLDTKIKKIGCEHTCYNIQSFFMKQIRKWRYKNLNQIISLTEQDLNFYKKINSKSIVIYNPLTYSDVKMEPLKNRENVVCLIGRLSQEKQFDKLFPIIRNITQKYPEWYFEIYGDGKEREKLESMIKNFRLENNIFLKGRVNDIKNEIKKKSIFLLCSKYEGLPMVLLESLSCGLACISFDCETGPREIIKNEVNGILVENQNFNQLEKELFRLIENVSLREKLQINSKKYLEKFKIENIIKKWEELFERI